MRTLIAISTCEITTTVPRTREFVHLWYCMQLEATYNERV